MRLIKTFVLHLYIDPDEPDRLCGDVRPLDDTQNYPFKNLTDLATLLLRLIKKMFPPQTS